MKLRPNTWVLIQRYVTGNATPEERREIEKWISQSEENEKLVREVKKIWDLTPEEGFEVNVQYAWQKFKASKAGPGPGTILYLHNKKERKSNGKLVDVFRAVAFLLVAFVTGYFSHQMSAAMNMAGSSTDRSDFYTMQLMTTERGEKARVMFSDGTEVILNSASSLQFPAEFHSSMREVYLVGEAHFKVAPDPGHPFLVHVNGVEVKVLGTEFNIRGWEEDASTEVIVSKGKVSVRISGRAGIAGPSEEVVLPAGYYTSVDSGETLARAQQVDADNYLLWTSGGMHFDHTPMVKVIRDLERRFDVHVEVVDEVLNEIPYTGTFLYADLDEVLSVIAATVGFKYIRDGKKIEFRYDADYGS